MSPRSLWFAGTLIVGLALDQATKAWVSAHLEYGVDEISIVPGWFSLVQARNTGAAFSTMEGQRPLFLVFTVIAVVVITILQRQQEKEARFVPLTLGMILAGALGNGIDRATRGYVVDFFKAYAGGWEWLSDKLIAQFHTNVWPIFNVADSLLLVGVALFAVHFLIQREGEIVADDDPEPEADPAG